MFDWKSGAGHRAESDAIRLERIEHKLDLLLRHFEIGVDDAPAGLSAEVRTLAEQGQLIAAIKRLREETGASLAEAKAAVDAHLASR